MALFAWLPLFFLQLFSAILGMDLHNLPAFGKIEVLRWHQPICTSASPCNNYESRHCDIDQAQKVLNVREVRESIDIDEIEPSTLDWPVIYEKLYAPEHSEDARSKRHFNGRYLPNDTPPAILVTKVIDSPVTATITGRNCINGVPSCVDGPTRVPILLSPEQEHVLPRTYNSVVQSINDAVVGQNQFVEKYARKKEGLYQQIIDEVSHKKDAVVQAVESVKKSIVDELSHKKDAIVEAVSGAAAAKHKFVQGIIDKKKEQVQPIIDAINEKKDKIVGVVADVAAAKYGYAKPVVEKVEETKEQLVEAVSGAATAKQEFVEGFVEKKKEKIQDVVDKVHEKEEHIVAAVSNATASKKGFVEDIHEKLQEKKDKIVEVFTDATAAKQEFVEGIVEKKKEKLHQKKEEIAQAASSIVKGAIDKKHEKIQDLKDGFSTLSAEKLAAIQKVINKTKHIIHEFEEAKEKVKQDLTQKKQEFVQSIADKKIAAIKHASEKAQEYIGTASLVKPLIKSQIKQMFNKDEEQLAREIDEGDDFVLVDEDGNEVPVEQTQGRTIGLFKKFILKKKLKPSNAHNESTKASPAVEEPSYQVVLTQQTESTTPESNNPIEKQISVEVPVSSTTEEIVSVIENHEVPTVGPTGIEVPEQVTTSSSHNENVHEHVQVSATSSTIHEQTSNDAHEQTTILASSAHAHEEVAINVDTPTTVANKVVYVPVAVHPIPITPIVVHQVPVIQSTPVVVQTVPVAPANPPLVPCKHSSTVELPTSGSTFTFGADIKWISKSGKNDIEAANDTEEVAAKNANVEAAEVNGSVDVEGKHAQVDFDEIIPNNADVDERIAQLLSKFVSDEDVAANSGGVFAKNANVDSADSKSADVEVVAKNGAAEAESLPVEAEKVANHEEVVTKN